MKNVDDYWWFHDELFALNAIVRLHILGFTGVTVTYYPKDGEVDINKLISNDVCSVINQSEEPDPYFISSLIKDEVVTLSRHTTSFDEFTNSYNIEITVMAKNANFITDLFKQYVKNRSVDQYGIKKQISLVKSFLLKKYKRLENRIFSISTQDFLTESNSIDLLNCLNLLTKNDDLEFKTKSVNILTDRPLTYDCTCVLTLKTKLLHSWRINNGYVTEKIRFDMKTGQLFINERNCQLTNSIDDSDESRRAKFIDLLVKKVNTFVSYKELGVYTYDWEPNQVENEYATGKRTKVSKDLRDMRDVFKRKFKDLDLENILSFDTNFGIRLNFCLNVD